MATDYSTNKKVTPEDILKAAKENGYEWFRHGWFDAIGTEDNPITSACILGQAALNLGVDFGSMYAYLKSLEVKTTVGGRVVTNVGYITSINDNPMYGVKSYKRLVSILERLLKPHMENPGVLLPKQTLVSRKVISE